MSASLEGLGSALAHRYAIQRELGHGANAVVYLAHDLKYDRNVAIKVLAPELALAVRSERFLREIQIAARLSHPHILPLLDSGAAAGFLYYVMPYIEGESLRDLLRRERQLALKDALRIIGEVAAALSHAHAQEVIHRDIKPENILLSAGVAVLADFGIARALTVAGGQTVTETGIAVGTPAYMSPEQGAGSADVDARSDIYSLACVLYEMLVGHPPFGGATAQEILARHALDPVPTVRAARAAVPVEVERAVMKALAKQPADRFATVAEFIAALSAASSGSRSRWRAPVYAGLALAFLLGGSVLAARALRNAPPVEQSVAVLPFVNLSGDSANDYFSDGITEELINALVQVPGLRVPARTSVFAFKGKDDDVREVGRRLNVAHVLEASVRRAGNQMRITVQLINASDGYHLWSETYDRELETARDMFAVQEDIARTIVERLEVEMSPPTQTALAARPTMSLDAYDLYLRGRFYWNRRNRDAVLQAIKYFGGAIEIDPNYALAQSGLADAYMLGGEFGYLPRGEAFPKAEAAANTALTLDGTLAEAHVSLARVLYSYRRDWKRAEPEFRRAIALNPKYALAHSWYGRALTGMSRHEDAVRESRIAVELEPLTAAMHHNLGLALFRWHHWDDAMTAFRTAIELEPSWFTPRRYLVECHIVKGMFREALDQLEIAERADPNSQQGRGTALALRGYIYAQTGRRDETVRLLAEFEREPPPARWYLQAVLQLATGDTTGALESLERGVEDRELRLPALQSPFIAPLARQPRYQRLVEKVEREQ